MGGAGNDSAHDIWQTIDGGYVVAGSARSNDGDVSGNHGYSDMWVVKLDANGVIEWQRCLGGSDDEYAESVQQTADGGYIVAGRTWSTDGDVAGNHGISQDAWIVKLDSQGAIQWQRCLGGGREDEAYSIQQTLDGGYVVAGSTESNDGDVVGNHLYLDVYPTHDAWVVKLDGFGAILWQACLGGIRWDHAYFIEQTSNGGYVVAGETNSDDGDVSGIHYDGSSYSKDAWVACLDEFGNLQWQACLGGYDSDGATMVRSTSDEGYIVVGYTFSNDGDVNGLHGTPGWYADIWVAKLDDMGAIQWQRCFGGTASEDDSNQADPSIQLSADGGYIIGGCTWSNDGDVAGNHYSGSNPSMDAWVLKLDALGDLQWQRCLGGTGNEIAYSIQQTADTGYIVSGWGNSNDCGASGGHALVIKLGASDVGIPTEGAAQLSVFPNPSSESLVVTARTSALSNVHIAIRDAAGRQVEPAMVVASAQTLILDVSTLPPGLYTASIDCSGLDVMHTRFTIQR